MREHCGRDFIGFTSGNNPRSRLEWCIRFYPSSSVKSSILLALPFRRANLSMNKIRMKKPCQLKWKSESSENFSSKLEPNGLDATGIVSVRMSSGLVLCRFWNFRSFHLNFVHSNVNFSSFGFIVSNTINFLLQFRNISKWIHDPNTYFLKHSFLVIL